jgi:hypothetical protein
MGSEAVCWLEHQSKQDFRASGLQLERRARRRLTMVAAMPTAAG